MTDSLAMHDYTVLVGIPTMAEFMNLVRRGAENGHEAADESVLAREWSAANDYFSELQTTEAGVVDESRIQPLPEAVIARAQAALDDPTLKLSVEQISCRWALVELDRVAIYQRHIDVTYVNTLTSTMPRDPGDDDIVRLAISPAVDAGPMRSAQLSARAFAFMSASSDLRFIEAALLDAAAVSGYRPRGRAAKVIALFVGMSANYLSAVRFHNRLLLINGSHRAYALRRLGVTRAPCLVYELTGEEDLDRLGVGLTEEERELFLQAPRPPLFKDYFNPRLTRALKVPRRRSLLNVQFSVDFRAE